MSAAPSAGATRIELVDALRGFALLGVLLVNSRELSLFGFLTDDAQAMLVTARADQVLGIIFSALVEHKALTIFTLLFGIGFSLQTKRTSVKIYARRLAFLFAIGLGHGAFFYGDVLRYYAVIGFFLLPTARVRPWLLAVIGLAVALFPWPTFSHSLLSDEASIPPLLAFSGSSLLRMLRVNWSYDAWLRSADWGFSLSLLGRFLIGAAIGQGHLMVEVDRHARFWKTLLAVTLPVGLLLTVFPVLCDRELTTEVDQLWREATSVFLALGYIAAFVLLYQVPGWKRWLKTLVPLGRMSLTNYLLLSFAGIIVFYGVGFGIGPRYGLVGVLVFAFVIFGGEMAFSRWWLSRFNFGPVEWVWRCLTYGTILKVRKDAVIPTS